MRYLTADAAIVSAGDIDRNTFRWTERPVSSSPLHIPVAALLGQKNYLITDFAGDAPVCAAVPVSSSAEALSLSVSAYTPDTVQFVEWVYLCRCARKLGVDFSSLPMPAAARKKTEDFIQTVERGELWPDALLSYLKDKQIPWRTLYLAARMDTDRLGVISGFVREKAPTVQTFKIFVETLWDFYDDIHGPVYDERAFLAVTDRRGAAHKDLDERLSAVRKFCAPVAVQNRDNFESATLQFSFQTKSAEEYALILQKLRDAKEPVDALYQALAGYRIR